MSERAEYGRGFWDFCSEHPVAMVLAVLCISWGAYGVAQAVSGHYLPDDGFWTTRVKAQYGCQ